MSENRITSEEVARVALLARLELSDEEVERLRTALGAILGHMAELDAVDVRGVDPAFDVPGLIPRLRPDEPVASLSPEAALAAAPAVEDGAFVVPRSFVEDP